MTKCAALKTTAVACQREPKFPDRTTPRLDAGAATFNSSGSSPQPGARALIAPDG